MWAPDKLEGPSGNFREPLPDNKEKFSYPFSEGLMYEAVEVRRCLKEGRYSLQLHMTFLAASLDTILSRTLLLIHVLVPLLISVPFHLLCQFACRPLPRR